MAYQRVLKKIARNRLTEQRGMVAAEADRLVSAFGRDIPTSAPDPEEVMRRQRRKMLASMRRRSGRMSTILTGGESGGGMGLG